MAPATDVTARGALCTEAALLRSRVLVIRGLVRTLPDLAEASVVDAVMRLRPFVNHLAARGRAEEHILYPYAESASATGLTSLRHDHMRLEGLATAIAAWTPAMGRPKLALLLTAFCETAEAHLDLEADRCLSVVHEHTSARTERYLFGEIEIETFETVRQ
jgi:Hemerythrin HHE cation binding domain